MKPETPAAAEPSAPEKRRPPSRLRRWLKRGLWAFLGLSVLLTIFHRPLLRMAVNHYVRRAAESGGMNLEWTLGGTVLSGIDLTGVSISGKSGAPIKRLKAGRIRADYSLWRLMMQGPGGFVDELVMEDVEELELDPAKFPQPDPNEPKESPAPPKITVPRVRLQNVNARIKLADGDIVVRGLNLTLAPGKSGSLEIKELQLPWNAFAAHDVAGVTEAAGAKILLKSLRLPPDVAISVASFDLADLHNRKASVELKALIRGAATLEVAGSVSGIGRKIAVDATLSADKITPDTLSPWLAMPPDVAWRVEDLKATVQGPVDEPGQLQAALSLTGSGLIAANMKVDRVQLAAALDNGALNLSTLDISTGGNHVRATATAQMPEKWKSLPDMQITSQADVDFPQFGGFFTGAPPLAGRMAGKLTATLTPSRLVTADANLTGSQWTVQGVPVESVELAAMTDGKEVKVATLRAMLDAQNTVEATGSMGFTGARPVQAAWKIDLPNLERLARWSGRKDMPGPDAGRLTGAGKIAGNIADWQRQDFSRTTSEVKLDAGALAWKTGRMESLTLEATVADGRAQLQQFVAVLNSKNRLTASGAGTLKPPWEFAAKVDGDLSQLADFAGWLEALGAKSPIAGKALVKWEGSGRAQELFVIGGGSVSAEALRLPGMNESASLLLKTSHSGRRADIPVLEASMGQFKVSASGSLSDTLFEIPSLKISAGNLQAVEGKVSVPLDFTQNDGPAGPVDPDRNMDVSLTMKGMDLAEAARVTGQKPGAKGKVDADVKVTGTLRNPSADIAMKLQGFSVPQVKDKLAPADAVVRITLKDRRMDSTLEVMQKPLQTLRAVASAPVDVQKILRDPASINNIPLEATVTLPESDLNGLKKFFPAVASMHGRIGLTARISGTPGKPNITGELKAAAPAIVFVQRDTPDAREVNLRVRFDGFHLYIEEAGALLAGGRMTARGNVDWTDAANPKIDAALTALEALVMRDETVSLRADGQITCRGTLQQSLVSGRVELVRGRVFKEIEFLPLSLPNQLPPAPPPVKAVANTPPSLPPPFDKWTFAVDIVTRDPIRLLGNVLNGGVVSNLRLTGTGAKLVLEGKSSLVDARVRLPFSRMTISRGDILLTKEKPFEPELDLQGDSFVSGHQVTLYAYGPALHPKLRFTSSPPLPEGEIAALLATGSTSGDLRASQGEAANRAAFLIVSKMYRKLFRKHALNKMDEEPPRLSFSFSPLNSAGGTRNVSAIYEISKHLQAVGSMNQTGSFRGLLYYLIRFR